MRRWSEASKMSDPYDPKNLTCQNRVLVMKGNEGNLLQPKAFEGILSFFSLWQPNLKYDLQNSYQSL
jgi:hypothetical protein